MGAFACDKRFIIVKESGSVLTYAEFRREAAEEVLQGIPNVGSKRGKKKGNDSGSTSKQMGKGKRAVGGNRVLL